MDKLVALNWAMLEYMQGDARRIQHFTKVHAFARLIGLQEKLPAATLFILESTALVHDIGIRNAEKKYGMNNGKLQEQEGPAEAEKLLVALDYKDQEIERIKYLIAHHHTYGNIVGADYQILVEADFLVNLYEDTASADTVRITAKKIFRTNTGKRLLTLMFTSK